MNNNKVFFFTNIAPHYRTSLWRQLLHNNHWETHFFYGLNPYSDIQSIDFRHKQFLSHSNCLHKTKNVWLKRKVLIWQKGILRRCLTEQFDQAIFLGEMYCFSTWLAAIVCRMRGIQVSFWGHGLYGGEGKLKLLLRKTFYKLAHKHLLYERRAKALMINQNFSKDKLYVVFNSLAYETHKMLRQKLRMSEKKEALKFFKQPSLPTLVFIGRLTKVKKIDLLVKAANKLNKTSPLFNLLIIGDGSEKMQLAALSSKGILQGWIHYTGPVYDENIIGKYLYHSDLCISPGNVGLTAIHSLSLGTPVATHNNSNNQMPEVEAIKDEYNGFLFQENDIEDLMQKIVAWQDTHTNREAIRDQCYEIIDTYYNPNYQLTVFDKLINNLPPEI